VVTSSGGVANVSRVECDSLTKDEKNNQNFEAHFVKLDFWVKEKGGEK